MLGAALQTPEVQRLWLPVQGRLTGHLEPESGVHASTPPVLNPALRRGGDAKPSGRLHTRMGLSLALCLLGGGQLPACSAATRSPQFSPNP